MALRFGPKQAIDAFLPAPAADAAGLSSDPREPPHPDKDAPVAAQPSEPKPDPAERPFRRFAPRR